MFLSLIQQYQLVLLDSFLLFPLSILFWLSLLKIQIINLIILQQMLYLYLEWSQWKKAQLKRSYFSRNLQPRKTLKIVLNWPNNNKINKKKLLLWEINREKSNQMRVK